MKMHGCVIGFEHFRHGHGGFGHMHHGKGHKHPHHGFGPRGPGHRSFGPHGHGDRSPSPHCHGHRKFGPHGHGFGHHGHGIGHHGHGFGHHPHGFGHHGHGFKSHGHHRFGNHGHHDGPHGFGSDHRSIDDLKRAFEQFLVTQGYKMCPPNAGSSQAQDTDTNQEDACDKEKASDRSDNECPRMRRGWGKKHCGQKKVGAIRSGRKGAKQCKCGGDADPAVEEAVATVQNTSAAAVATAPLPETPAVVLEEDLASVERPATV